LIKTPFHPLFSREKHLNPSARKITTFLGDLDLKKTSAGMKQKAKQESA